MNLPIIVVWLLQILPWKAESECHARERGRQQPSQGHFLLLVAMGGGCRQAAMTQACLIF
jgi:hypothetical protein